MSAGYYFLLVGFCIISFIVVWFVYPETAHRTLEELGEVFGDKVSEDDRLAQMAAEKSADATKVTAASALTARIENSELTLRVSEDAAGSNKNLSTVQEVEVVPPRIGLT